MKTRINLLEGNILPALSALALPIMATSLIQMAYNLIDMIWIGKIGASAVASVGAAGMFMWLSNGLATLAKMGGQIKVGHALGAQKKEDAASYAQSSIQMGIVFAIGFGILSVVFADEMIGFFQLNSAQVIQDAKLYLMITCGLVIFSFMNQIFTGILTAMGNSRTSFIATGIGLVLNIVLDPLFIFVFRWGMMGAAVATVIGQVVTALLAVWYLFHMKAVKLEKVSFLVSGRLTKKFLPLGICSFLSQISLVAAMAAINNMIRKYGALDPVFGQTEYAQIPMAVVGIVMKFFQIVISISVGMAAGCIPIVGYNIGAGRKDRARALFTRLLTAEAAVGAAALLIVELFPRQLIAVFGAANESVYYTDFAVKSFRIYLCMMIFACVNKATFIYLQSLGKALLSTVLSMVREVVFGVGFALLLPLFFGLDGVLYSMPVSDILTFLVSAAVIRYTYRTLK